LSLKAKAKTKDLITEAKVKDQGLEPQKTKDLITEAKAKTEDLSLNAKTKDLITEAKAKAKAKTKDMITEAKANAKYVPYCPRGALRPRTWLRGLRHWLLHLGQ